MYSVLHKGEDVKVTYLRDGKTETTTLKPKYDEELGRYLYGFTVSGERTKVNFGKSLIYSGYEVKYWIYSTLESLKMLVTGAVSYTHLDVYKRQLTLLLKTRHSRSLFRLLLIQHLLQI